VIAHVRQHEDTTIIVAVPRFACSLMRGEVALPLGAAWKDWSLSLQSGSLPSELHGRYRNIFTGETLPAEGPLPLAEVFASFPAAVLVSSS
jgi:(1->4)-alpha-D-glucan 1-alpha-D-glucosylmutase